MERNRWKNHDDHVQKLQKLIFTDEHPFFAW